MDFHARINSSYFLTSVSLSAAYTLAGCVYAVRALISYRKTVLDVVGTSTSSGRNIRRARSDTSMTPSRPTSQTSLWLPTSYLSPVNASTYASSSSSAAVAINMSNRDGSLPHPPRSEVEDSLHSTTGALYSLLKRMAVWTVCFYVCTLTIVGYSVICIVADTRGLQGWGSDAVRNEVVGFAPAAAAVIAFGCFGTGEAAVKTYRRLCCLGGAEDMAA
ncbi:hypothetical protein HK101_007219 [Irineochytrium annulatum]|nr:hypothetical protein HK101_007219 [Irineochytrium annulatum]